MTLGATDCFINQRRAVAQTYASRFCIALQEFLIGQASHDNR